MKTKRYDRDFILRAVKMFKNGLTRNQVCRELDVPGSTFRGWLRQFDENKGELFPGSGNPKLGKDELYLLKKELAEVKEERDILKKATAYFSKRKK